MQQIATTNRRVHVSKIDSFEVGTPPLDGLHYGKDSSHVSDVRSYLLYKFGQIKRSDLILVSWALSKNVSTCKFVYPSLDVRMIRALMACADDGVYETQQSLSEAYDRLSSKVADYSIRSMKRILESSEIVSLANSLRDEDRALLKLSTPNNKMPHNLMPRNRAGLIRLNDSIDAVYVVFDRRVVADAYKAAQLLALIFWPDEQTCVEELVGEKQGIPFTLDFNRRTFVFVKESDLCKLAESENAYDLAEQWLLSLSEDDWLYRPSDFVYDAYCNWLSVRLDDDVRLSQLSKTSLLELFEQVCGAHRGSITFEDAGSLPDGWIEGVDYIARRPLKSDPDGAVRLTHVYLRDDIESLERPTASNWYDTSEEAD